MRNKWMLDAYWDWGVGRENRGLERNELRWIRTRDFSSGHGDCARSCSGENANRMSWKPVPGPVLRRSGQQLSSGVPGKAGTGGAGSGCSIRWVSYPGTLSGWCEPQGQRQKEIDPPFLRKKEKEPRI